MPNIFLEFVDSLGGNGPLSDVEAVEELNRRRGRDEAKGKKETEQREEEVENRQVLQLGGRIEALRCVFVNTDIVVNLPPPTPPLLKAEAHNIDVIFSSFFLPVL